MPSNSVHDLSIFEIVQNNTKMTELIELIELPNDNRDNYVPEFHHISDENLYIKLVVNIRSKEILQEDDTWSTQTLNECKDGKFKKMARSTTIKDVYIKNFDDNCYYIIAFGYEIGSRPDCCWGIYGYRKKLIPR